MAPPGAVDRAQRRLDQRSRDRPNGPMRPPVLRPLARHAAALALLALGACAHKGRPPAPAPLPVERPLVALERAKVESVGFTGLSLSVGCRLENPNPFDLPAGRLGLGLLLSDREVARIDLIAAEPVPPGGEAMLAAPVRISVLKAGTAAARLLLPFTSLDVRLKGEAVFDGVPVPLDLTSSLLPR